MAEKSNTLLTKMAFGGLSGMTATTVLHPVDTIKVNIQTTGKPNPLFHVKSIYSASGINGFYKGLTAAWYRQAVYTSFRLGVFSYLYENNKENFSFKKKIAVGAFSGFTGSFLATPADLILVRQQADKTLEKEKQRKYKGSFDAFKKIYNSNGIRGLWKGSTPIIVRATVLNSAMLTTNYQTKEYLEENNYSSLYKETLPYIFGGLSSSFISLPFDHIKTNYQRETNREITKHYLPYVFHFIKNNGITSLYKSLPIYTARIMPHSMISMVILTKLDTYLRF
jgi:solute carrier family 25 (mitochondrial oxoglutarate transporter), member 11